MARVSDKVWFYPSGRACPHCIWLADDPELYRKFKWSKITPFAVIPPYRDFLGVTVYDSHGFFKNTFNCVNGVKEGNLNSNHNFRNIGSLLMGATMFIEELHIDFGVKKVRLLINSNLDIQKHGAKEHPHALITLADEEKEVDAIFKKISATDVNPTKFVISGPYPGDTVVNLSSRECTELIRSGNNAFRYISKIMSTALKRDFNPNRENFFIFLAYECTDPQKPHCGIVTGKISTR
jgi:hypothetical protein